MVKKLYDLPNLHISEEAGRTLMMDTLFICQEYRNVAAHGGRTYNYECKYSLRKDGIFGDDSAHALTGFNQLLFLLSLLNYQSPFHHLNTILSKEVDRHCRNYPQDVTHLAQILNVNIEPHQLVWVSDTSNKYHSLSHCSGLHKSHQIDIDDAKKQGYVPCKKCY